MVRLQQTIGDLKAIANAWRGRAYITDIRLAYGFALNYYIRKLMKNRFRGRRFNPSYPKVSPNYRREKARAGFGNKPLLVRTGTLQRRTLRSARVVGKKRASIVVSVPEYGQYLRERGFNFVEPGTNKERIEIRRVFLNKLKQIRTRRLRRR